mmetsp:Transcript_2526/g.5672  ORF Transcript_2526/g.5672 Transcript_2526/m.5672 type:complete len:91 (+) Transcript_2526:144-416(+)
MVRHPKECRACGRKRCGFSLRECNPKRSAHGIFRFTDIGSDDTRSGGYFSAMRFTSFVGGGGPQGWIILSKSFNLIRPIDWFSATAMYDN